MTSRRFLGFAMLTTSWFGVANALAADLPVRKAPAYTPAAQLFTWTGFYIGANAGGVFASQGDTQTIGTPGYVGLGPTLVPASLATKEDGFIGGGQLGYNYQIGSALIGLEADFDGTSISKSASFTSAASVLGTTLTTSAKAQLDYLGTVRGRLGFTPTERLLVYGTGGLAYGDVKTTASVIPNAVAGGLWSGSTSNVRTGYAVGGGLEYAVTNNVTLKGEYLYYDLGKTTTNALGNGVIRSIPQLNGIDYISQVREAGSIVRVGANYKF
jgi:outer membrane immunogenic protein